MWLRCLERGWDPSRREDYQFDRRGTNGTSPSADARRGTCNRQLSTLRHPWAPCRSYRDRPPWPMPFSPISRTKGVASAISLASSGSHKPLALRLFSCVRVLAADRLFEPLHEPQMLRIVAGKPAPHSSHHVEAVTTHQALAPLMMKRPARPSWLASSRKLIPCPPIRRRSSCTSLAS